MSGILAPIQDLLARLSALQVVNGDGVTVSLYARIWNNQIKREESGKDYSLPSPAAFVEVINSPQYGELGSGFQSADLGFKIHLFRVFFNQDGTLEQDLEIFGFRDQVVQSLNLYNPTACGPMTKTSETQEYDHKNAYHYILDFVCNFIDSTGSPFDTFPGDYIDSIPPTTLQDNIMVANALPDEPGSSPENKQSTFQSAGGYKIKQ